MENYLGKPSNKGGANEAPLVTSSNVPVNWQPETLFVLEPGVYALMARSNKPMAKQRMRYVYETILPTIRKTGKFEVSPSSASASGANASVVEYDKKLADAQIESLQLKLELSVAKYDARLAENEMQKMEIQHNYERQIMEYKNSMKEAEVRELQLQNTVADMNRKMSMTTLEFGVNALLAKDNMSENDQLRASIHSVENRIIPEMSNQPDKEHYTSFYLYSRNGDVYVIVMRVQLKQAENIEKIQRQLKRNKLKRQKDMERYEWLKYAVRIVHEKTPNAISLWNKIKDSFGQICYGFCFENKSMTKFRFYSERSIREKYRRDVKMCEEDKKQHKVLIEKFKALGFEDEEDAVRKSWTKIPEATERLRRMVDEVLESVKTEVAPKGDAKRYDNVNYSVDQIVSAVNSYNRNYCNMYIQNLNINTFKPIEENEIKK